MHCLWEPPVRWRCWLNSVNYWMRAADYFKEVRIMTEASPFDKACELAQAIKQSQAFNAIWQPNSC